MVEPCRPAISSMFFAPRQFTLGTKLVALVTSIVAGSTAALLLVVPAQIDEVLRRQSLRRADAVAMMLAHAVAPGLDFDDTAHVSAQLAGLARSPDALYAGVRYPDGRLLSAWKQELLPRPRARMPLRADAPAELSIEGSSLAVERPVATVSGQVGLLQVGFSLAELEREQHANRRVLAALATVVFLIGALLALALSALLVKPLKRMNRVALKLADGDIAGAERELGTPRGGRDEAAALAVSFSRMLGGLRETTTTLQDSARVLTQSVGRLTHSSGAQTATANRQVEALERAARSANDLRSRSAAVGERVEAVIEVAERAEASRMKTEASVADGLAGFGLIRSQVEEIASRVRSLNEHIGQAGGITETVRELADQSHTLAVNASIEAARAGEQGKGFAIIAQHVRTLADQSIEATQQVQQILAELTAATEMTASFTGAGVTRIEESLAELRGTSERLAEMAAIINESGNALRQIAGAVRDQAPGVDAITDSVSEISSMMEEAMNRLEETNQAVRVIEQVSASVANATGRFRT
jgi:methyl-accepting chemotaxis protein